jgi:hypothetical protein
MSPISPPLLIVLLHHALMGLGSRTAPILQFNSRVLKMKPQLRGCVYPLSPCFNAETTPQTSTKYGVERSALTVSNVIYVLVPIIQI